MRRITPESPSMRHLLPRSLIFFGAHILLVAAVIVLS
jgi:hypothetical protein